MSRHTTGEEVRSTASEKFFGLLLSVFIFIGLVWAYLKIGDLTEVTNGKNRYDRSEDAALVWRLLLVLGAASIGAVALTLTRRRQSRYVPVGGAILGATAGIAMVALVAYTDLDDNGLLALSLLGIAICLAGFFFLQREIRKRIPLRRVRKGECPFCGFPSRPGGSHCEGCGRLTLGECRTCHQERRIGTPYCSSCGSA